MHLLLRNLEEQDELTKEEKLLDKDIEEGTILIREFKEQQMINRRLEGEKNAAEAQVRANETAFDRNRQEEAMKEKESAAQVEEIEVQTFPIYQIRHTDNILQFELVKAILVKIFFIVLFEEIKINVVWRMQIVIRIKVSFCLISEKNRGNNVNPG